MTFWQLVGGGVLVLAGCASLFIGAVAYQEWSMRRRARRMLRAERDRLIREREQHLRVARLARIREDREVAELDALFNLPAREPRAA